MTRETITTLAASGESETLEFKASTGTRREATMTVCAFLNQDGGQALFGVTQAGVVVGQAGQRAHQRGVERRAWTNRASGVSDGRAGPCGRWP